MKRFALVLLVLGGCDALPRDPDGTLDRVLTTRRFAVGYAAPETPASARLVEAVARDTGAAPVARRGGLEPLIADLDAGRVDLVIAEMTADTPWKTMVAPSPPIAVRGSGKDRIELRALMKNGENRWIMRVERAARRIAPATAS